MGDGLLAKLASALVQPTLPLDPKSIGAVGEIRRHSNRLVLDPTRAAMCAESPALGKGARAASFPLASVASKQAVRPGVIAARGEKSIGSVAIPIAQARARQLVEVELLADNNGPEGMLNRQPLRKYEPNKKANRPIG